jgi:Fe2+ or Zn2+ uptake regulation protein
VAKTAQQLDEEKMRVSQQREKLAEMREAILSDKENTESLKNILEEAEADHAVMSGVYVATSIPTER